MRVPFGYDTYEATKRYQDAIDAYASFPAAPLLRSRSHGRFAGEAPGSKAVTIQKPIVRGS
jgi:hypothetical protein